MKTKIYAFIIAVVFLSTSCDHTKQNQAEGQSASKVLTENTGELSKPLNPNIASADELKKYFSNELVQSIVQNRPFTTTSAYIDLLKVQLNDQELEKVCQFVFLPINLNTADEREILSVPGVGEKMAHEFDEYRPYKSIEQFRREIGKYVSKEQVTIYEKYVFVPIDLNHATKEAILTIPGVGKKMAHEFEEYRPYASIEEFRREIGKYVDENELRRLERYVVL